MDGEATRDRGAHTRAQAGAADWTSRATPDAERMSGQQRAGHEVDGRSESGARNRGEGSGGTVIGAHCRGAGSGTRSSSRKGPEERERTERRPGTEAPTRERRQERPTGRAAPDAERMSGQQRAGHEVDGRSEGGARTGQATERSMGRNSDLHLEADDCTHYVVEPKYQALHRGGRRKRASPPGRMAV